MNNYYDHKNIVPKQMNEDGECDYIPKEDFVETKDDGLFNIGDYEGSIAKTIYCRNCGSREFNVGTGSYYTAIKCIKCEWEVCIHDG